MPKSDAVDRHIEDKFYDIVKEEGYSGVPVNWIRENGELSLNLGDISSLIECGKVFSKFSWAKGTSGNLSFRYKRGIGVTATKTELGKLIEKDIVEVTNIHYDSAAPTVVYRKKGEGKPTSEVLAHWEIYKTAPEINVILHGHDNFTTMRAKVIAAASPDKTGITKMDRVQGTREFAYDLKELLEEKSTRRYLISKQHGFFSLGNNFYEALAYAKAVHLITSFAKTPIELRRKIDYLIPDWLQGKASKATDKLEWLVDIYVKASCFKKRLLG
ncbi:MAG: class II aldolase/adducin family protein [Candidatus Nanoarchaeia archaeon]|nr:class II aldolase/adducin family protein [Candidatus Nanoarchaeia archaeon]